MRRKILFFAFRELRVEDLIETEIIVIMNFICHGANLVRKTKRPKDGKKDIKEKFLSDFRLRTADCGLRASGFGPRSSDFSLSFKFKTNILPILHLCK